MDANIEITKSNSYYYTDSLSNDMVLYTGTSNQHILFGTQSNMTSHMNFWHSNITFNRLANFSCNVTVGSNNTTGLSNYTTLQTNHDFALIGNNISWSTDHGGPALYMRYSQTGVQNASYIQSINRYAGSSNMLDMQIQASNIYFATGGLTANINVTFKPDGKVGIGISNPSEILHIIGNIRTTGTISMNSNQPIVFGSNMVVGNAARIGFNITNNSNFLDILGGATPTSTGRQIYFWIDSNQSGGVSGRATFGGGDVYLNTGSLSIGTSNPLSRFHIQSNALCYTLYTSTINNNGIIMGLEDGAAGAQIWNSSNGGYIKFGTSNTERLKIAVNGYVGIGVSNPINMFQLHNPSSTVDNVFQMTNAITGSNLINGFQIGQDITKNIYFTNQENTYIKFSTNNIERMRLSNTGALGIGITTPATLLHMTSNTSNYITHTNTANPLGVMFGIEESATGGGAVIWQSSNAHIKFGTNNIERIRMTSNGYIGIGTQIPGARLTVTGYDNTTDSTQYGLLQLIQNPNGAITGFHSNIASISIIRAGNQVTGIGYAKAQNIFGFGVGTNSNVDFIPQILSMNSTTNCIGINNSNPLTTIHALSNTYSLQFPANQNGCSLSLYNSAGAPGAILFGQANTGNNCGVIQFGYTASGNNSNFIGLGNYNTDNTLVVTAATNVGIGTTSPIYKLDVNGTININKSLTTNNKLLVLYDTMSSDSLTTACNFYGFGINGGTLRYQSVNQHTFYSFSSNVMVIAASGWTNIGIGTSVPTFTTDIWQQNSNTKMLRLTGDCYNNISTYDPTNDDFSQFSISSCNNVTAGAYKVIMRIGVTNSNNYGFIQMVNPSIGKPQLCLQPQIGNVGINTSNPIYALDVGGGIRANNEIISNGAPAGNHFRAILGSYGTIFRNDANAFYILNTNSNDQYGSWSNNRPFYYVFTTGTVTIATGAITALDSGNVGIGQNSPGYKLDVNGSVAFGTNANTRVISTDKEIKFLGGGAAHFSIFNSNTTLTIRDTSANTNLGTNGTTLMAFSSSAALGISMSNLLRVTGGTNCQLYLTGASSAINGIRYNCDSGNIALQTGYGCVLQHNQTGGDFQLYTSVASVTAGTSLSFPVPRLSVLAGGNVGINNTNPNYQLTVSGDIYTTSNIRIGGNNALYFENWGGGWYMNDTIWIKAFNDKQIYTGGTIATNYRLGIGTTVPDRRLQITDGGSGDWIARITNGLVNTYFSHSSGYGMHINTGAGSTTATYALQLHNGITNIFTLYNNGQINSFGPIYLGTTNNLGPIFFANNQDGASYTVYQGGLASWCGIGFRCEIDGVTRHVWDTRTGNYSLTGTLTSGAISTSGLTCTSISCSSINTNNNNVNAGSAAVYAGGWFRSTTATGWYNETYSKGIYAKDNIWVRTYPDGAGFTCGSLNCADINTNNSTITVGNGNVAFNTNGGGLTWAGTNSRIYDQGNLQITTDDNMYVAAPNLFQVTSGIIYFTGNVGIGTASPGYKLDVAGNARIENTLTSGNLTINTGNSKMQTFALGQGHYNPISQNGDTGIIFFPVSVSCALVIAPWTGDSTSPSYFSYDGGIRIGNNSVQVRGGLSTTGALTQNSDDRLKTDENLITNALSTISKLRPQTYYKHTYLPSQSNYGTPRDNVIYESGLIAQEVFYTSPELRHLVKISEDADINAINNIPVINSDDPQIDPVEYTKYWGTTPASINYIGLIPYLIESINELSNTVNILSEEITKLKATAL